MGTGRKIFPNSDWNCGKAEVPSDSVLVPLPCRPGFSSGRTIFGPGGTTGRSRRSAFTTTGPIICVTSGVCVPGASCRPAALVCFGPFVWANRFENAPIPSSATKTPKKQRTEAIKTRRLKKADFEVDFFFMDG